MKKNMVGILMAAIVALVFVSGCSTPTVTEFPDGSHTVKVKGRSVHVRTVIIDGKKYILKVDGYNGSSLQPFNEGCD